MSTKVKDVWVERDERIRTESKLSGIQETVLRLGRAKWGPSPEMEEAVLRTTNRERLEALTLRLLTAESWADLMAVPE